MQQALIAIGVAATALIVAFGLQTRRKTEAPTQPRWRAPSQLDRGEFSRPQAQWLVAIFSSATCNSCAKVVAQAAVLECAEVVIENIDYNLRAETHRRYHIDAVPTLVIADQLGVVRASFVGPMTATDLWAALAELRDPGSTPPDPNRSVPKSVD